MLPTLLDSASEKPEKIRNRDELVCPVPDAGNPARDPR